MDDSKSQSSIPNQFLRDRPGSMISIGTKSSASSRSSVNCTTGKVKCPNFRLQKFFSYKPVKIKSFLKKQKFFTHSKIIAHKNLYLILNKILTNSCHAILDNPDSL